MPLRHLIYVLKSVSIPRCRALVLDCSNDQPGEGGSGLPLDVERENVGDCGGVVCRAAGLDRDSGPGADHGQRGAKSRGDCDQPGDRQDLRGQSGPGQILRAEQLCDDYRRADEQHLVGAGRAVPRRGGRESSRRT